MRIRGVWAAALLAAAFALPAEAAPSKQWTVTQLPDLAAYGGSARAINNRGEIVGTSQVAEHHPHPVIWDNGAVTDILAGNPTHGVANAINDKGMVAATQRSGVIVWKDGVTTPLNIAGEPLDINRSGDVVGLYYPWGEIAFGPQRAFHYRDGVVHELPGLSNNPAAAGGLNDKGVVVGYATPPFSSDFRAVVWQNGVLRELPGLGGRNSAAGDVNNHGVILGTADAPDGRNHMVTWDVDGRLLQDFGPRLAGHAINDRGAIVGNHLDTGRPFLLEDGVYTWLLDLPAMREQGWASFAAFDINDRGWIVGVAWKPGVNNSGVPLLLKPR